MDHILYQLFKIILSISSINTKQWLLNNPPIKIYVNKIKSMITLKIKTLYYLKLLTVKLVGSTKNKIMKNEKGENIPLLEIIEVVIVCCNAVNNYYIQNSLVLYIFISNKSLDQLLDISPKNFVFLKTFNSEFPCIEVWFTDQNSKPLENKNKIDIA